MPTSIVSNRFITEAGRKRVIVSCIFLYFKRSTGLGSVG